MINNRGARFLDIVRQNNISKNALKEKCIKNGHDSSAIEVKDQSPKSSENDVIKSNVLDGNVKNYQLRKLSISMKRSIPCLEIGTTNKEKKAKHIDDVTSTKDVNSIEKNEVPITKLAYDTDMEFSPIEEKGSPIILADITIKPDTSSQISDVTTSEDIPIIEIVDSQDETLTFSDKTDMLNYITQKMSMDEVMESYANTTKNDTTKRQKIINDVTNNLSFDEVFQNIFTGINYRLSGEQNSFITNLIGSLSDVMQTNKLVTHKVLDTLSINHSDELLEHSLQENSVNMICDKLKLQNVINYIIHKINTTGQKDTKNCELKEMNKSLIMLLINCIESDSDQLTKEDFQLLLDVLFKNRPKIEIFDSMHNYLRKLLDRK